MENSERDGNTRMPYLPPEKSVFRPGSNSENQSWNNELFKIGKEAHQAIYYHLAYLTYMHSTSWGMPCWMNHSLESSFLGEISINPDMRMKLH